MGKYRKKPVVIEAIQWNRMNYGEIREFTNNTVTYYEWFQHNESGINKNMLTIPTLEGNMTATDGDFIIKGVNGEFYPANQTSLKKHMKK
jgi:hypothetical protein